jgi:hypothetical protein
VRIGGVPAGIDVRIGVDPEDHQDLIFMDLNALDQGADDLSFGIEIDRVQPTIDGGSKLFEPVNNQK